MNAISAQEIKRRGVIALQEAAQQGAVHILKNNHTVGIFLNEKDYQALLKYQSKIQYQAEPSLVDWMLNKPVTGQQSAESIEARLNQERSAWSD